ncbi:hypothetical protein Micbo1qcDRAFT_163632 [Microdochium bolleyi]|uniref:Uncharacterized protein n=1 Tax=Microdochium bolleyi TaxID=196109 RepID=A0A136J1J0_9PEZI|nr:hypothetical protein Micbo1qcDRAFT_163632 [Microdochium bolleyi]
MMTGERCDLSALGSPRLACLLFACSKVCMYVCVCVCTYVVLYIPGPLRPCLDRIDPNCPRPLLSPGLFPPCPHRFVTSIVFSTSYQRTSSIIPTLDT